MEHRWDEGFDCQIQVLVEAVALKRFRTRIEKLSLSGAFLRTEITKEPPVAVFVQFDPDSGARQHRRGLAYVIRQTPEGVGLEWAQFAPRVSRFVFSLSSGVIACRGP